MNTDVQARAEIQPLVEVDSVNAASIPELSDRCSACDHGPYSAYCKVCWNPIYMFWIDKHPHNGVCPFGHTSAMTCPDVMAAAHNTKVIREARAKAKALAAAKVTKS